MTTLGAYLLGAMVAWVPVAEHASFEPRAVTAARYERLAEAMATAATEEPVVDGDAGKTGLVLASLASYESRYAARVVDCRAHGGTLARPAWGPWQTEVRRARACSSLSQVAALSLGMVAESLHVCARWPFLERLALYTDGRCGARPERSRWRLRRAQRYWLQHVFGVS